MTTFIDNRQRILAALERGIRNGLEDVADAICEKAILNAPVKTGTLQRSISSRANQGQHFPIRRDDGSVSGYVDVPAHEVQEERGGWHIEFGAYCNYASSIEFGAGPHIIEPDPSRTMIGGKPRNNPHLRFTIGGRTVYAKQVKHPGNDPQPFMRPAIDEVAESGMAGKLLQKSIVKELRKDVPYRD